jgi:hypothetical protein
MERRVVESMNDLFNESELRLLLMCLDMWTDERSREALRRELEVIEIRRKLVHRIEAGR